MAPVNRLQTEVNQSHREIMGRESSERGQPVGARTVSPSLPSKSVMTLQTAGSSSMTRIDCVGHLSFSQSEARASRDGNDLAATQLGTAKRES